MTDPGSGGVEAQPSCGGYALLAEDLLAKMGLDASGTPLPRSRSSRHHRSEPEKQVCGNMRCCVCVLGGERGHNRRRERYYLHLRSQRFLSRVYLWRVVSLPPSYTCTHTHTHPGETREGILYFKMIPCIGPERHISPFNVKECSHQYPPSITVEDEPEREAATSGGQQEGWYSVCVCSYV